MYFVLPRSDSPLRLIRNTAVSVLTIIMLSGLSGFATAQQVFINELHYDNASTDAGEAIEVAGPAGTNLAGWSLVLYNGSNGSVYGTTSLSGIIANQQGGLGTIVASYSTNGIQNGSPDGIALVDAGNNVIQFLSYEGSFTAVGAPAGGMTSTDIGVTESSGTPVGHSLQLTGMGSFYSNFTWAAAQANTFGAPNTGQTFGGGQPAEPELVINEIDYDQPGADNAEFIELKNVGGIPAGLGSFSIELVNGTGGGATVYQTIMLPSITLGIGDYFVVCADASTTLDCDLDAISSIQNGAPDAVALLLNGGIVDAVSYEGDAAAPYVEGSGAGLVDSGSAGFDFIGISRFPDGADTDQNNVDLSQRCITPGTANTADAVSCPDPLAGPPVVINEIHADPASGLGGDANNDGIRDPSDDEFVEIVNKSGGPLDLSGWTLADGASLRHTFPTGSIVADQCAIVLFGGGSPTGAFGGTVVQTASSGALGLNNGGDTVTLNNGTSDVLAVSYGGEGGSNQSLTLDPDVTGTPPYVQHTVATGSSGTLYSSGTKIDATLFDGCEAPPVGPFEIFEIQGSGSTSPFAGQSVITQGNVVTALSPSGFFMQTPSSRTDGDVDTSDGIFVFTGGAPGVAVGDLVDVTGDVIEFFGFTEFGNSPTVTVLSTDSLPAPVVFDAAVPSPDPLAPSCAIEFECYEGMLVTIPDGTVTGPNQRFNTDTTAEVHITAASARTFRETWLEFPGMPGLPVWDGNPEVFELDPDKLGLLNQVIPAGSHFSATGVIGFEFGGYEMWPTELSVSEAMVPRPVRHRNWLETTVASLNLFRLFDDVDDPPTVNAFGETIDDFVVSSDEYQRRLDKFARYIVDVMKNPDIIGVQEVEKLGVLEDLAAEINSINRWAKYQAYVVEGNDIGGIDVGFLVRKWRVWVKDVEQLGADETYVNPTNGELDILHDRPPLLLKAWTGFFFPINVMVVHNRSLGGIETERVQVKRLEQAQSIAQKVQDLQSARRRPNVVVVGDFNAFEFTDGFVDAVGHIRGDFDPAESLKSGTDLVEPDLMNQIHSLPDDERYSFIFRGNAQTLDHALTNSNLDLRVRGLEFARGNADAAVDLINDDSTVLRASDHDGLVLYIYTGWIKHRRRW